MLLITDLEENHIIALHITYKLNKVCIVGHLVNCPTIQKGKFSIQKYIHAAYKRVKFLTKIYIIIYLAK